VTLSLLLKVEVLGMKSEGNDRNFGSWRSIFETLDLILDLIEALYILMKG
jgi:hypothetical protein